MSASAFTGRSICLLGVLGLAAGSAWPAAILLAAIWSFAELSRSVRRRRSAGAGRADAPGGHDGRVRSLGEYLTGVAAAARQLDASSADIADRLERLERDLKRAGREVVSMRELLATEDLRRRAERATSAPVVPLPVPPAPPPPPAPAPVPASEPGPSLWERLEGIGSRLFAWSGGVVLLLGVVFLFAFATRRGLIGPEARLVMGGVASAATLLAGLWLRRRHGTLYAALAAVGVGLAGLYTTILAAAALYDYLPPLLGLAAALVVAGVGTAVALAWSAEIVAGLALVGAMLLPVASFLQGERSLLGLGFVAILMAAVSVVALRRNWLVLLCVGALVSAAQLTAFVADSGPAIPGHTTLLVLAAVFWAVFVATGVAYQLALGTAKLGWLTPSLVLTPGVLLAGAASRLLETHEAEGAFLLGLTAAYAVLGAGLMQRHEQRNLATLAVGAASVVAVFGFADLLSGEPLVVVLAVQAPILAWIASRTGEARFRIAAAGYLVLATCHTLAVEAQPRGLFEGAEGLATGAWTVAALAASTLAFAWLLPAKESEIGDAFDRAIAELAPAVRVRCFWASGVLFLYALSLATLALAPDLETGHVALTAVWSAIGLALTLLGSRRGWAQIEWAGLALLSFAAIEAVAFDWRHLAEGQIAACFWTVAAAMLLAGHATQLLRPQTLSPQAFAATLASAALATAGAVQLFTGDAEGASLLVLACVYAVFAVACHLRRLRDLSTLDWALALCLATAGCAELLSGIALVAVGAAGAALLAWLAARIAEQRLLLGSASLLALTLGYALVREAPPSELFLAGTEGGPGAAAVALCAGACFVLARYTPDRERPLALWAAGVLSLYALSLAILETAPDLESGHVALAAAWSAIGLALTVLGLHRGRRPIEWAGVALIGVTAIELVAFDWGHLSDWQVAACFWIAAAAALMVGHAEPLARPQEPSALALPAMLVSVALATAALLRLLSGDAEGLALLVLAAVYAGFSALSHRRRLRDLSTLDWALALCLANAGSAELFSGIALVAVGAAGAALLAWLAARIAEQRLLLGSASLLALTLGYALVREAPPSELFLAGADPGLGAAAIALCAGACFVLARYVPARERPVALLASAVLSLYALSLATLALAPDLETGHIALTAVWSTIGIALTLVGLRRSWQPVELAGLGLIGLSVLEAVAFDWGHLSDGQVAACFWIAAAAALVVGHAEQLARPQRPSPQAFAATLVSVSLATAAVLRLFDGEPEGMALLLLACVYVAAGTGCHLRRLRDLSTLNWALALCLATAGCAELLSGIALVAVGAAGAALLAWLATRIAEQRLLVGSASLLALTLGYALVREAPLSELFRAGADPGPGAAAVALCAGACFVLARYTPDRERPLALWAAGVLSLYALSLAILEAAEMIGAGSAEDTFQRGHTVVSGAWALVALAFLYLGLMRRERTFQLLGFAIFGVALAKIFFFDLPSLSSVTRALSFMAVGSLLLAAGHFYQRLAQRTEGVT